MKASGEYIIESERKTEIVRECDVLVAGGGIGGIAAALSAARNGARTLLVEREYLLGGLATLGLITIYLPLCDGKGRQAVFGIGEELFRLAIKHGTEGPAPAAWLQNGTLEERTKTRFIAQYNPHLFALEVERLLLNEGVELLYGSVVCGVQTEDKKIKAAIIENKSGRSAIRAKSYVDCTGDADICKHSGAKTELYKKKNILAEWYYYMTKGELKLNMFGYSEIVPEDSGLAAPVPMVEKRFSGIDGQELSEMVITAHEHMLTDIIKNRQNDETYTPVTMATIPEIRMSRRIAGKYVLDGSEMHKHFDGSIGLTGDWRKRGPVYEIPYETLYGDDIENLIAAGRCISVTDDMWDITRVIPPCAVTGQAAGAAAAMTDNFAAIDIKELQYRLERAGVALKCW
jgi:hypothetical protein